MRDHDIAVTRENYLDLAYLGNPPAEFGPELEAELPDEFQGGRRPRVISQSETKTGGKQVSDKEFQMYEVIESTVYKKRRSLPQVLSGSRSARIAFAILLDFFPEEEHAETKAWALAAMFAKHFPDGRGGPAFPWACVFP
jgi:hypothetical protein